MPKFMLHPRFARRLPDPFSNSTHGTQRHIFFVAIADVPAGISLDPSPRAPTTRWDVYKEVQASLLNQNCTPGTFHLKNHGITIVAKSVDKIEENEYRIDLEEGQGVIDGAHTYRLIMEANQNKAIKLPKQQYVRVEIITSLPKEWMTEVSGALNTSILGQRDGTRHLQEAMQWMKDELADQRYAKLIAWSENDRGLVDVKDLLSIMTCFNTAAYPNPGTHHPVVAYENRSIVLSTFEEDHKASGGKAYRRLRPILKDILSLHDIIQSEFPKFHSQQGMKAPELIETSAGKPFLFPFLGTQANERLAQGALYPVLASFRWLVEDDPAADAVRWRGGLETVLRLWRDLAEKFVVASADKSEEVGKSADAVGKTATHWSILHKEVALAELTANQASGGPQAPIAKLGGGATRPIPATGAGVEPTAKSDPKAVESA